VGLDADGTACADSFGFWAKKGDKALIGSGGGKSQYAWYTNMVVREVEKTVNDLVQSNGGCPDSKFKAVVRIVLNEQGSIVEHMLLVSSGDKEVDHAISEALEAASISEPPPMGMPRKMKLKIST